MQRRVAKDFGLALLLGGIAALSPLTSGRLGPSVVAGLGVGGAVFAYRFRGSLRRGDDAQSALRAPAQLPAPSVWLTLFLFLALFSPTAMWMYGQWTGSIWTNSHGIFVPLVMAYLGWHAMKYDDSEEPAGSAWGFAFLVPGLLLTALDAAARTQYLSTVGLVLCLPGLVLLFLGTRRARLLLVPLAVGLFMIPVPNTASTHLYLRNWTAEGVEPLLRVLGFTTIRDGTLIEMPRAAFVVSDACSGFATLYAAVGVALILACYAPERWRKAALVLSAVPLALAANILRVLILILLTQVFGPALLDTPIHEGSGVVTFWVVLTALWAISDTQAFKRAEA